MAGQPQRQLTHSLELANPVCLLPCASPPSHPPLASLRRPTLLKNLQAMSWAAPDTFMLEFLPKDFYTTVVWEEAAMIGAQVTVLPVEPADKEHNMEIPPELVADALRRWLGQPPQEGAGPQLLYKWDLEQYRRRR